MGASEQYQGVHRGEGWAVGHLDDMGSGPGFRKVRQALGVEAFGVNAIVLPVGIETGFHYHDRQEELYFLHSGSVEIEFGDGSVERLEPGGFARVDPGTVRRLRNVGSSEAVYVCAGGAEGYVGRDGRMPDGEQLRIRPTQVERPDG